VVHPDGLIDSSWEDSAWGVPPGYAYKDVFRISPATRKNSCHPKVPEDARGYPPVAGIDGRQEPGKNINIINLYIKNGYGALDFNAH
jgi:hypothetical protein